MTPEETEQAIEEIRNECEANTTTLKIIVIWMVIVGGLGIAAGILRLVAFCANH